MSEYKSKQMSMVAENLYRDGNGGYQARFTRKGKAHKKALKTSDLAMARRKLRDYEKKLEKQSVEKPDITFDGAVSHFRTELRGFQMLFSYMAVGSTHFKT